MRLSHGCPSGSTAIGYVRAVQTRSGSAAEWRVTASLAAVCSRDESDCLHLHAGVWPGRQTPGGSALGSLAEHCHVGGLTIQGRLREVRIAHVACLHAQARVGGTGVECGSRSRIQLC